MKLPDSTIFNTLRKRPVWLLLFVSIVIGPVFNAAFNMLTIPLQLPFFFDTIATVFIAAVFGPFAGVITGLGTNWVIELFNGFPMTHYPFCLCGAVTGLIVGFFVKKDNFSTVQSFFIILLIITLANAVLGALIATFLFGGISQTNLDYLVTGLSAAGRSIFSAAFLARLPANLIDKGIALGIAFVIYNRFYMHRPLLSFRLDDDAADDAVTTEKKS